MLTKQREISAAILFELRPTQCFRASARKSVTTEANVGCTTFTSQEPMLARSCERVDDLFVIDNTYAETGNLRRRLRQNAQDVRAEREQADLPGVYAVARLIIISHGLVGAIRTESPRKTSARGAKVRTYGEVFVASRDQYLRHEQHCREMATSAATDGERRLLLNLANIWRQMANDVRGERNALRRPPGGWSTDADHLLRKGGLQSLQSAGISPENQDGLDP